MKSRALFVWLGLITCGTGGCAAIGLTGAAVGAGSVSAGAGAAVRAGTEYTRSGVLRTFSVPLPALRLALGETLARMEIAVVTDETDGVDRHIVARAREREIEMHLVPLTRTVTQLKLTVGAGFLRKDRATASEIVVQLERTVDEHAAAAHAPAARVRRDARGNGASSLPHGARR